MPIAHDAASNGGTTGTSLTFSHTCTGSDLILLVGVGIENASDLVTGVTYNGVSMTLIDKKDNGVINEWCYLYYLVAPATGANNVVVSLSSSTDVRGVSVSYTGAKQSGQPRASVKNLASSATSITTGVTAGQDNWVVAVCQRDAGAPTAGTGVTLRATQNNVRIGDSNAGVSAGTYNMEWTGTSSTFITVQASIDDLIADLGGSFLLNMI